MEVTTKQNFKKLAITGMVAKGAVYFLMGALTASYTLDLGGEKATNKDTLFYITTLPGGKFLLGLLAFGLMCYSFYRFTCAFTDFKNVGSDAKGIGKRIAFAFSGLIYGSLAFLALRIIFGSANESSSGGSQQSIIDGILDYSFGEWLVILIGLITIGNGLYQIRKAFTDSYMKDVSHLPPNQKKNFKKVARAGFVSRGIVFAIIGFLFIKAGWYHNANAADGVDGAFSFLQSWPYGNWLLLAVALGLMAYGIFMFVQAKYNTISNSR